VFIVVKMKRVLLIDVDSKIPNIALMKVSTYYKSKGYVVELKKLNHSYYPKEKNQCLIDGKGYDKIFVSIIFKINRNIVRVINCKDVMIGGVGYCLHTDLPKEIKVCENDYSIYPDNDCSYGFLTRGCIRNCYFCVVPEKEGMIHKDNNIKDIVRHKKVKFMDNNILAYKGHKELLQELINKKIRCQFNQGLDIRLINDQNAELLSKLNYMGEYIFAFDSIQDEEQVTKKLKLIKKYIKKDWKLKFYIYCNPDMNIKDDVVYRVDWCKRNKVLPYLMRDQSCWNNKNRDFYIDLCAWCNQVSFFKKITFSQFMEKRTKNITRISKSVKIYTRV